MTDGSQQNGARRGRSRLRVTGYGVTMAAVLAAVIFGISALSSPKNAEEPSATAPSSVATSSADAAAESRSLYQRALGAQASGNTTEAADLARQAVAADPTNQRASQLYTRITSGQQTSGSSGSKPSGGSGATTSTAGAIVRVKDLKTLLPSAVTGYSMGSVLAQTKDVVVTAEPTSASSDSRRISTVLFGVHNRGSASAARAFQTKVMKRIYFKSGATVTVAGTPAYFGTDGGRLAAVTFSKGPYAYELVVTVPGGDPASMKQIALGLAEAFRTPH